MLRIARDHGDEASPFVAWQELGTSAEISPGLISCFCWNKEIEMCTCTRVYSRSYSRSLMVSTMAIDCRYCTSFRDPGTTPRHNCWSAFSRRQICAGTLFSSPPPPITGSVLRVFYPTPEIFALRPEATRAARVREPFEEKTPIRAGFVSEERGARRALEKKSTTTSRPTIPFPARTCCSRRCTGHHARTRPRPSRARARMSPRV